MTQPLVTDDSAAEVLRAPRRRLVVVPDLPAQVDRDRWEAAWEHRSLLLALARQRVRPADAEDVVSEAMIRAATADGIRSDALRPWLVTTTLRLCADDYRRESRDRRRDLRLSTYEPQAAPAAEEPVVEQLHAEWVARQVDRLPDRQAQALKLKAAGHDVAHIAVAMLLPYKTVESLLSRGRHSVRGWVGATVLFFGGWRVLAKRKVQIHVAAATIGAAGDVAYTAAKVASAVVTRSF
jgi:RNA polymerase sigma factor (sigma-70 family)